MKKRKKLLRKDWLVTLERVPEINQPPRSKEGFVTDGMTFKANAHDENDASRHESV
ncbi:hypothetical protein BN2476_470090 [Paraburkholderia piptadeniae]|uniref:Uncharacterized protein n=1 Tax=Paraburkholderia piptadeniae TaxID=1701573 RepID=A0A1N7SE69_9BURK|nr:hypothetical protein BN2476_470090 [Paraburkholderia piptadeniae]